MSKTAIAELGEFGLIKQITSPIELKHQSTLLGVGDDAAVIKHEKQTVVTTDMLLEGIHFDLIYTPLKHLGYKAVVVNVSDILAMNATPKQIVLGLGIDKRFSVEMVEELMEGVHLACQNYQVDLIGGDTSSSLTGLTLSVTAMGEAEEKDLCYRNGAKANDLICVTGNLGAAYLGLQLLEREKLLFMENKEVQPDLEGHDYLLERQLKPEARADIIKELKKVAVKPTAMIDISDGLSSELLHICTQSNLGCTVYEDKIPIDYTSFNMAEELNLNATTCALNGGEDYELLFTVPLDLHKTVSVIPEVFVIGHMTEAKEKILETRGGQEIALTAQGWTGGK